MPNYEVHKKVGFIASFVIFTILVIIFGKQILGWKIIWALIIVPVYANASDIDHYMGKLRKRTLGIIFSGMVIAVFVAMFISLKVMFAFLMILGLLGLGLLRIRHRGPMHTYWFATIISLPIFNFGWVLGVLALASSYSHIFIDRLFSRFKRRAKKVLGVKDTKVYNLKLQFKV